MSFPLLLFLVLSADPSAAVGDPPAIREAPPPSPNPPRLPPLEEFDGVQFVEGPGQKPEPAPPEPPKPTGHLFPYSFSPLILNPRKGSLEIHGQLVTDLGAGHVGQPLLLPLSISHALNEHWTLGWLTGDGICIHGQGRCPQVMDQIAMEVTRIVLDTPRGLGIAAARLGAGLRQFPPNHGFIRAGALVRYTEDYLALQFDPLAEIAFNHLSDNPNRVRVPIEFQLQPEATPLILFARMAFQATWTTQESHFTGPAGLGAYFHSGCWDVGLTFALPRAIGTNASLSDRTIALSVAWLIFPSEGKCSLDEDPEVIERHWLMESSRFTDPTELTDE